METNEIFGCFLHRGLNLIYRDYWSEKITDFVNEICSQINRYSFIYEILVLDEI
jgi:hypothetical protein